MTALIHRFVLRLWIEWIIVRPIWPFFLWRYASIDWALIHLLDRLLRKSINSTSTFVEWIVCIDGIITLRSIMRWRLLKWIKRLAETTRVLSLSKWLLLTEDRQFFLKLILLLVITTVAIKSSLSVRIWINNLTRSILQADLFFPKSSIVRDFANIWSIRYTWNIEGRFWDSILPLNAVMADVCNNLVSFWAHFDNRARRIIAFTKACIKLIFYRVVFKLRNYSSAEFVLVIQHLENSFS